MKRALFSNVCACVVLATLLCAPGARAQPSAEQAARHFERGLAHVDAHEFDAAVREFQTAYELSPHYSVNYNIGLAHAASGHALGAVQAFERYLTEGGADVPPERRTRVRALIRAERAKIARLVVDAEPTGAQVSLDGKPASLPLEGLKLNPGVYELVFAAPGYVERRLGVTLLPGETAKLSVTLDPVTARSVELRCALPEVRVEIDGVPTGQVSDGARPLLVTLPPQARELGLRRAGYRDEIIPLGGATSALDCRMTPIEQARTAELRLRMSESGARITLDGVPFRGEAQVPGVHLLRVERSGFVPFTRRVTLLDGRVLGLDVVLVPTAAYRERYEHRAQTQRTTAYALGIGGLGVAAGAIAAGIYSDQLYGEWVTEQEGLPPPGAPLSAAQRAAQTANDARKSQIQTLDRVAVGLGVASTLLVGTAVWLYLDGDDPGRYGQAGRTAVGVAGSTFTLRTAF